MPVMAVREGEAKVSKIPMEENSSKFFRFKICCSLFVVKKCDNFFRV